MINRIVLEQCNKSISAEIGTLDDLPYELANTIANYYYKYFLLLLDMQENSVPSIVNSENNIFRGLERLAYRATRLQNLIEVLPGAIESLRNIDQKSQPNLYKALLRLVLDIYKYNIDNATTKIGLRRMVERKFAKVEEIPNLVGSLNLYKE